ncbi:MAG: hypothetical protein HY909_13505 [Deltaproteobacteria bacterium]|nr:hypothetical protein [Deltaproteobacteria bacterium]
MLERVTELFERPLVPRAVADETRWSHRKLGSRLVPDLGVHSAIKECTISNDVLRVTMETLFRRYESRATGRRAPGSTPEIAEYQGKIYAWSGRLQLTHAIPDLEVVVLARQLGGTVIADDARALRAAEALGVPTLTTREFVSRLEARGFIPSSSHVVARIEATGYMPTNRAPRP